MTAHVCLLGGPTLRLDGSWQAPPITRPVVLLSYLAYREAWVDRDELTALFWPETGQRQAKQSLRALLYQAKRGPLGHALEVEPLRVRWAIDTDVHTFVKAVSAGDWRAAVDVYAGTFLERVPGDDSSAFEAWLGQTRDELHASWRDAVLHVADDLSAAGRARDASDLLQRLFAVDFLDEDVLQACMRAHATAGDRGRALEAFRTFSARLAEDLDMTPMASTRQLADAIRNDAARTPARAPGPAGVVHVHAPGAPRPLTPFVGRRTDLLELGSLLARPDVRLVTLLGPGGVGKTRLSVEVLETRRHAFEDGAAFVALEGLHSAADVPSAVASALGLQLTGSSPIADDVFRHLQPRAMLIVLDNVEHLIGDGVAFVQQLLDAAPRCTFMCTSRAVLGLPGEAVVDLAGLTVPSSSHVRDLESYDAVQLFVGSARRARSDFTVQETERDDLVRLCVLLDGMPLALELAASWVRVYRLSDLIATLERDLDLLESTGHTGNERHRSLRAVFDHSWQLLDDEQRRVLSSLTVFDGSFELAAVEAVAHAAARTLLTLIDRSLVRRTDSGRFSLHMDVRQYATARSTSNDVDRERHATYYLGLVERSGDALVGAAPAAALTALEEDLDNVRTAWRWACDYGRFDLCDPALEPLNVFFTGRALLQEGNAFFELALHRLGTRAQAQFRARLHHQLAYFSRRLDRHAAAGEHAREALRLAEGIPDALALTIDCLCELVVTNCWKGYYADAAAHAERALAHADTLRDADRVARCTSLLALARRYQDRLD
ncbi:MAG: BTAD domain-containing putative transcriptional regulator, partial [Trueperaceae bacterium]